MSIRVPFCVSVRSMHRISAYLNRHETVQCTGLLSGLQSVHALQLGVSPPQTSSHRSGAPESVRLSAHGGRTLKLRSVLKNLYDSEQAQLFRRSCLPVPCPLFTLHNPRSHCWISNAAAPWQVKAHVSWLALPQHMPSFE